MTRRRIAAADVRERVALLPFGRLSARDATALARDGDDVRRFLGA